MYWVLISEICLENDNTYEPFQFVFEKKPMMVTVMVKANSLSVVYWIRSY